MRRNRSNLLSIVGIALVVLGCWLIFERTIVPMVRPLADLLHVVGHVAWPLALIVAGAIVISTARGHAAGEPLFTRSRTNRVVGGVLAGAGAKLGIDANVVRVVYVVFTLACGLWTGALLYVLALALVPEEPVTYSAAPAAPVAPAPSIPAPPVPPAPARAEA